MLFRYRLLQWNDVPLLGHSSAIALRIYVQYSQLIRRDMVGEIDAEFVFRSHSPDCVSADRLR